MSKSLADFRRIYSKGQLMEAEIPDDPLNLFQVWFEQMEKIKDLVEVNAMTISTMGLDGFPKNRVVLLKEFGAEGFTFFTNYNSEKAEALKANPHICLSFFWAELERQVIIKGKAEKCSEERSTEYFQSRPRGSQIGAWASNQSREIASREVLEESVRELENKFVNKDIPKPEFWGGYLVRPVSIEFWQGRPNRLHDRILYTKENEQWLTKRLAP
ncbi:pyridoxamine 5'-phosphate oxidase [Antarcticibacterium sp. 1MA-6-2]|uniref:pyridoxamine 5'-phosphate oxidase n=1 Tax=Antarcticibacterium sp. 1MA-6-2 TaxID=2908210 RepID=UPI001F3D3E58|nr:pyridoxamine 5'-phosphate oxidase [Antarcticibacterium sp. 1MA-6-2]UJH91498.1 pyridoxamine 5'-phosphate oxidase [Antarcticibacterium sp. 1MA-6-2]